MGGVVGSVWGSRVVLAVIAVQVAVPVVALVGSEAPTRFGFQMYSGLGTATVTITDSQGHEIPFDSGGKLASFRPEIDWTTRLPDYLCEITPGAHRVTVRQSGREGTATCD